MTISLKNPAALPEDASQSGFIVWVLKHVRHDLAGESLRLTCPCPQRARQLAISNVIVIRRIRPDEVG